ncbi:MAG: YicC/YloC family endoribonuclease [Planctomycetota bacterium]|jgi:uncharacterized protein (TIGR00255 family)
MTGAGSAQGPTELGELRVEARSVNGRNLVVKCRLPGECQGMEPSLDAMVRKRLKRGSVSLSMDLSPVIQSGEADIDAEAFARVHDLLAKLASDNGMPQDIHVGDVLSIPGVIRASNNQRTRTSWEPPEKVSALVTQALDALIACRAEEGAGTLAAVRIHLQGLQDKLAQIRERAPEMLEQHRSKIIERVNEFLETKAMQLDEQSLVKELAVYADRVDISEELQRMQSHLDRFTAHLDKGGELGRRLEFLLQEMLRESNTIGSKSPDVEVAHTVVDMKSEIEKLREQAANLE